MSLSPAEELLIVRDTLRGLDADIVRAELLEEPRLETLTCLRDKAETRVAELEAAAAAEEEKRLAAVAKDTKAAQAEEDARQAEFEAAVQAAADARVTAILDEREAAAQAAAAEEQK
jgi:hypothetical protein